MHISAQNFNFSPRLKPKRYNFAAKKLHTVKMPEDWCRVGTHARA